MLNSWYLPGKDRLIIGHDALIYKEMMLIKAKLGIAIINMCAGSRK